MKAAFNNLAKWIVTVFVVAESAAAQNDIVVEGNNWKSALVEGHDESGGTFTRYDIGQTFKVSSLEPFLDNFTVSVDGKKTSTDESVIWSEAGNVQFRAYIAEWTDKNVLYSTTSNPIWTSSTVEAIADEDYAYQDINFAIGNLELDPTKTYAFYLSSVGLTDGKIHSGRVETRRGPEDMYSDGFMLSRVFSTEDITNRQINDWVKHDYEDVAFTMKFSSTSSGSTSNPPNGGEPISAPLPGSVVTSWSLAIGVMMIARRRKRV